MSSGVANLNSIDFSWVIINGYFSQKYSYIKVNKADLYKEMRKKKLWAIKKKYKRLNIII